MREKSSYKKVHDAADYYEPLLRARIQRAMRALQKALTVEQIAQSIAQGRAIVPRGAIINALKPAQNVIHDAFLRGGKIGADRLSNDRNRVQR